jgi:hypothetical protein
LASKVKRKKGESKVGFVQREFKAGQLHSGSKSGPKVMSPKQAIAIGLSQQRKEKGKPKRNPTNRRKRNIGRS